MTPDARGSKPRRGTAPGEPHGTFSPPTLGGVTPGNSSPSNALTELSAATTQYKQSVGEIRSAKRRSGPILALVSALILGAFLTFVEPFEYVCGATFRLTAADTEARLTSFRTHLLDYAWQHMGRGVEPVSSRSEARSTSKPWYVDTPAPGLLRLCLATSDPQADTERLGRFARGYIDEVAARAGAARSTPTEAEVVLAQFAAELQARLDDTRANVEQSLASVPTSDPTPRRDVLVHQWRTWQANYLRSRDDLAEASVELARLEAEPEPAYGIVSPEDRNEALLADDALQQDLRELEVNLTELKLHLLNVWQESAGELEHLAVAADELIATRAQLPDRQEIRSRATERAAGRSAAPGGRRPPRGGSQADRPVENRSHTEGRSYTEGRSHKPVGGTVEEVAGRYRRLLETFSSVWNGDFAALRGLDVDPLSGDLLTTHRRLRTKLNDFLFSSSKHLATLRAGVGALGSGTEDRARLHVFESNVVRSFQAVQTAHRRFEFAAGAIDTRDNFRLDCALRSAGGLHRRSQKRISRIDQRLQEEARRHAVAERAEALLGARKTVERLRAAAGQVVEELVNLQEKLNLSADLNQEFLRSTLRAELAEHQAQTAREDLTKTEGRVRDLVDRRASAPGDAGIELIGCGVIAGPVNLEQRLRIGGIGALTTLLVVGLGQWWLNRRQ